MVIVKTRTTTLALPKHTHAQSSEKVFFAKDTKQKQKLVLAMVDPSSWWLVDEPFMMEKELQQLQDELFTALGSTVPAKDVKRYVFQPQKSRQCPWPRCRVPQSEPP